MLKLYMIIPIFLYLIKTRIIYEISEIIFVHMRAFRCWFYAAVSRICFKILTLTLTLSNPNSMCQQPSPPACHHRSRHHPRLVPRHYCRLPRKQLMAPLTWMTWVTSQSASASSLLLWPGSPNHRPTSGMSWTS